MTKITHTVILLCCSNIFMTFAWYAHLRNLSNRPWFIAAFASWGIALFEYLFQVPANRIGNQVMTLGQLKILQEVIDGFYGQFLDVVVAGPPSTRLARRSNRLRMDASTQPGKHWRTD